MNRRELPLLGAVAGFLRFQLPSCQKEWYTRRDDEAASGETLTTSDPGASVGSVRATTRIPCLSVWFLPHPPPTCASKQRRRFPMVYIYALCEPDTGEVRYIGKAVDPQQRLAHHLYPSALKPETHKNRWLRQLLAQGLKPTTSILESVTDRPWQEAEREWIARYRESGANLTNILDGGIGGLMSTELSDEIRARWSALRRGRKGLPMPPELRAKLLAIHTGAKRSEQTRALLRAKALGRRWTDEQRARMSEQRTGHPVSEETRAKIGAKHKGKVYGPETSAKISAARRRKGRSNERA